MEGQGRGDGERLLEGFLGQAEVAEVAGQGGQATAPSTTMR